MPKTLLLADDSVTIQKVVGISFANEDVRLVTVDNGDDAVARAREVRPDVVLADVVMPGMSGYEVCEAIKADPEIGDTPVLLLTGTFEAFDEARARACGADGHITKPFEAQALVDTVNEQFAASAARQGNSESGQQAFVENDPASTILESTFAADDPLAADDSLAAGPETRPYAFDLFADAVTEPQPKPAGDALAEAEAPAPAFDFAAPAADDAPTLSGLSDGPEPAQPAISLPGSTVQRQEPFLSDAPLTAEASEEDAPVAADAGTATMLLSEPEPFGVTDEPLSAVPIESRPPDAGAPWPGDPLAASPLESNPLETDVDDAFAATGDDFGAEPVAPPADSAPFASDPPSDPLFGEPAEELAPPVNDFSGDSMLDPASARDYDVSFSDLGASATPSDPWPVEDPSESPQAWPVEDPSERPRVAIIEDSAPAEEAGFATEVTSFASEAASFGADSPTFDAVPATHDEPLSAPDVQLEEAEVAAFAAAPEPSPSVPDLGPLLADQIHETLEKVAWEALGDVSERIVEQALERIEKAAWEVIPQMAETLIREEIRKLKQQD